MSEASDETHFRAGGSDAASRAASMAGRARADLAEGVQSVKDKAMQIAEAQKASGAEKMQGIAGAVHAAAGSLEQELPQAAGYIHQAAESLEQASTALKERNLDELMGKVGDFARTQPMAFFGTAVFAGFALSRFLKSSAEPPRPRR